MTLAGTPEPVRLRLPAKPESVLAARHAASAFAKSVGADADAVALAVSETVTNAVLHAYRGGAEGEVEVKADRSGTHIVISVVDTGGGMAPNPDGHGLGYGLSIVTSLADEVGMESVRDGGTRMRMRFSVS